MQRQGGSTVRGSRPRAMRIAVLNSHPIQYFAPLYAYLNANSALEVTALYLSDVSIRGATDAGYGQVVKWDLDLLKGYPSIFLGDCYRCRQPNGFWSLTVPEVWSEVCSGRYDILWLHGHNYAANLIGLLAAKRAGVHVMMRGETHAQLPATKIKAALRNPLLRTLYALCDRFLAIGSANAKFYRMIGVPDNKIFLVPYSIDNERFMSGSRLKASQVAEGKRSIWNPSQ